MPTKCYSLARGKSMRVTRVDECCAPVFGTCSQVVTDGFVSVSYSAEIEDAEEILLKNAYGEVCVLDRSCPELKFYNIEIEFCQVDPDLFEMITGQPIVTDYNGDAVGFDIGSKMSCDTGFALEVWSKVPGEKCADGTTRQQWGYTLVPCIVNGILGDFTIENDAVTFTVTAESRNGHAWGTGPYNVVPLDDANTAGRLLNPVDPDVHLRQQLTSISPPDPTCGCRPLAAPATGINVTTLELQGLTATAGVFSAETVNNFDADGGANGTGQLRVNVISDTGGNGAWSATGGRLEDGNGNVWDLRTGARLAGAAGDLTVSALPAGVADLTAGLVTIDLPAGYTVDEGDSFEVSVGVQDDTTLAQDTQEATLAVTGTA